MTVLINNPAHFSVLNDKNNLPKKFNFDKVSFLLRHFKKCFLKKIKKIETIDIECIEIFFFYKQ